MRPGMPSDARVRDSSSGDSRFPTDSRSNAHANSHLSGAIEAITHEDVDVLDDDLSDTQPAIT